MITGFLLVLGGLIGAAIAEEVGAVTGAFIGYVFGHWITESRKADAIHARLRALEKVVGALTPPGLEIPTGVHRVPQPAATPPQPAQPITALPITEQPQTASPATAQPSTVSPRTEVRAPTADYRSPEIRDPGSVIQPPTAPTAAASAPTEENFVPTVAQTPAPPPGPTPFDLIRNWFFGGNTVVRVGIIILLFGVGFLVKYAAEHSMFPVEARLACAALLGIALLVVGFRLRDRRLAYAVSLQGGGIGIIYLVTFATFKVYHLIPAPAALGVFIALGIFTGVLSVLQDAMALAVLGIIGGFLAPILASEHHGDHVALFTYYAILNAGILGLAWFKSWRVLNLVGFTFTFVIGTAWGLGAYKPENYASTQFFLALFFVFYAAIAVIYALKRPSEHRGFVDGTLTFGLPAIAFALQVGLVKDTPWGLAISAVVVAAFYIGIATIVWQRAPAVGRQLAEAFTAIGVVFVTMALPFALNAQWTAAAYALEGAGLVWVGRRQKKPLAEAAGVFLQFAAGVTFDSPGSAEISQPIIDRIYPYALLRAVGAFATAYFLRTRVSLPSKVVQSVLVVWALGWLLGGVAADCTDHGVPWHFIAIMVSAAAAHHVAIEVVSERLKFTPGRIAALLLGPLLLVLFCMEQDALSSGGKETYAWLAWLVALMAWVVIIKRDENVTPKAPVIVAYALTPILFVLPLSAIAYRYVDRYVPEGVWSLVTVPFVPALVLAVIVNLDKGKLLTKHARAVLYGAMPVVLFLVGWSLIISLSISGDPAPLPYIPLVTPLDVTQAFLTICAAAWAMRLRLADRERFAVFQVPLASVLVAVVFVHLSAVCVRSVHFYAGVPWDYDDLFGSQTVQATLSIAWTVIALIVTTLASRKHWRVVWMIGGSLLAIVVLKLFLIDLSSIGTGMRIVSFIVVGLLLLLIGWLSPVPPKRKA